MLARQLGVAIPAVPPPVPSRVADWCAHTFRHRTRNWLIFCNTASLYPVLAHARKVTDGETLVRRAGGMALEVLQKNGFPDQARILDAQLTDFQFGPVPDRSVLGSINELVWLAGLRLDAPDLVPWTLSQHLGRTPMSALGMNSPAKALASLKA